MVLDQPVKVILVHHYYVFHAGLSSALYSNIILVGGDIHYAGIIFGIIEGKKIRNNSGIIGCTSEFHKILKPPALQSNSQEIKQQT